MMPSSPTLLAGINLEDVLKVLRPLSWGAADILRAYARGEQPPHGFSKALSVDNGGEGPVSAADLAVNQWLLDGLKESFPSADWTLLSEETAKEQLTEGQPLAAEWLWILDPLDGTKDFLQGTGEYAVHLALVHQQRPVLGVVLVPEREELVKKLALSELRRLNVDVNDFIRKHTKDNIDKIKETEKKLLQEDKKNVKDK